MASAALAGAKAFAAWLAKEGVRQAIVKIALQVAATAVVAKLTTPNRSRPQGLLVQTDLSAEAPRRLQVGRRLNGGVFVDWLTKGSINEDTWRIFYLGEGPMGDLKKIYADGRVVFDGTLTHGNEVTLTELDSRVRVRYYDGRPGQTADANLVASNVGWSANHVGTGMAYCVVYARYHDTKLNVPPDMSFETEGAKLYDRRKDSTAGGSGTHRLKDPATWEISTNLAVALDHYLLGRFLSSSDVDPWFGVGLDPSLVPYADFATMANLCDEQVTLKGGGTQKRYEMNGFIFADEVFRDVIRKICDHMNARPADFGGLVSVIDGESRVPVLTLDRSDAIDESVESYKPKVSYAQIVGGVEGRYQDPANGYQPTDYPRYTESAWRAQDGGETKYVTRDFDYEVNQERAERLASLFAKRSRRQATLTGVYPLKALVLEEGDWFTRTGGKFGAGKVFEVVGSPVLDVETMTVTVSAVEVDPNDSAWDETAATDQAASPDADPSAPALAVPNVSVLAIEVASSGTTIPGARFKNSDYTADPAPAVEIELALDTGSGVPGSDKQTVFMVQEQHFVILTGLLAATDYVARWRGRIGDLFSAWSSWTQFTSTGTFAAGEASTVAWSGVTGTGRPQDNATVGARAGTNLYRSDGATVMSQAEVRTPEGVAAAIAGQDWGATASQAQAENAQLTPAISVAAARGGPSAIPDHDYFDAEFWNFPAGAQFYDAGALFSLNSALRTLFFNAGTYDFLSSLWPVEPGETYEIVFWWWNGFPGGTGPIRPMLHIPNVAWHGLMADGASVNPDAANASDIVTGGTSGVQRYTWQAPTVTSQIQFWMKGTVQSGTSFVCRLEMRKAPAWNRVVGSGRPQDNATVGAQAGANLYRTDGATVMTQAEVRTPEGVAAAVAGQGALATANRSSRRRYTSAFTGYGASGRGYDESWRDAASLTIQTATGDPVEIQWSAQFEQGVVQNMTNSPYVGVIARILRNGSPIGINDILMARINFTDTLDRDSFNGMMRSAVDTAPPAGSTTYKLQFRVPDAEQKPPFGQAVLLATGKGEFFKVTTYEGNANDV